MKPTGTDATKDIHAQETECGPDCSCTGGGRASRLRMIIGILVLTLAAVFVARAIIKSNQTEPQTTAAVFSASGIPGAESRPAVQENDVSRSAESTVKEIDTLADLNTMAVATDVVFVYLPGTSGEPPIAQIKSVARTIGTQGNSVGIFTLKMTAPEYKSITAQVHVPCVLVMVKGCDAIPISGEITEVKLLQGFITASTTASCGPSGCGPSGCN